MIMVSEKSLTTTSSILGLDLDVIVTHLGLSPKGKDLSAKMIPDLNCLIADPPDARSYGDYHRLFKRGIALWF